MLCSLRNNFYFFANKKHIRITMKKFIFGILTLLVLVGCGNSNSQQTNSQQISDYKFLDSKEKRFDNFQIYWLKDNDGERKFPYELFGEVDENVKKAVNMPDGLPSSISAYLLKSNGKNILFDSGLGVKAGGLFLSQLSNIGITPEMIDYVYITHFHGDHIGGMLTSEGEKAFPNAEVYVSKLEKESELGKSDQAVAMLEKYADKLHVFDFGDKLPEDVFALDAVGTHSWTHCISER